MTIVFSEAMATDLDPSEMFALRSGEWIPRGAVLAILAFLDTQGVKSVAPAAGGPDGIDQAIQILRSLDPKEVEAEALERSTVGGGYGSTTAAVIAVCVDALVGAF
jgi:hypothetical protein